ncbi:hypothetical protein DFH07DRAFT_776405 [Mycena maculata]|uniref:Uncharacterized protein n=1 Tax=Mycena maculata TaxID=230809 RepID=A0AAD7N5K2_9AGAR|nr:hypothetical protein DFH07DRAFT_776405 [Mycena maculata]
MVWLREQISQEGAYKSREISAMEIGVVKTSNLVASSRRWEKAKRYLSNRACEIIPGVENRGRFWRRDIGWECHENGVRWEAWVVGTSTQQKSRRPGTLQMRRHGIISILAADSAYLRAEWEDKSVERGAEEDGQRADWKGACQEEEEMTRAGRAGEKEGRECRRGRLDKPRLGQGPRVAQGSEEGVAIACTQAEETYKEVRQWEAWLEQIKAVGRARVGGRREKAGRAGGSGREGLGTRERRRGVAWHRHGRIDNEGKEARPMGGR